MIQDVGIAVNILFRLLIVYFLAEVLVGDLAVGALASVVYLILYYWWKKGHRA